MRTHVAIFSYPIPALAHPTFSIVSTFVRRGYRVTYVTSERFATEAAILGAEVIRCPRLDYPFDQDDDGAMPVEYQYVRDPVSLAWRTFAAALPFYQKNKPDFIIYDSQSFAGLLVADRLNVAAVRMSNQFNYDDETLNSSTLPLEWKQMQLEVEEDANRFFAANGSKRQNVIRRCREATFYLYLQDLQLSGPGALPNGLDHFYAARCIAERPNVPLWRPRRVQQGLTALVASSTTYNQSPEYYKSCLTSISRLGWETIVAVDGGTLTAFESLPPKCQPIQGIPLSAAMPHVDLLICAAGMATAMEAMYHGVPMLMLTGGHAELEAYGDMFQAHGMGVHLRHSDAAPDNVAKRAVQMSDDSELRQKVRQMQSAVKRSAGAEELVNWLEEAFRA